MQTVNMDFIHDGKRWIARTENLEVAAASLEELDGRLREAIKARCEPESGSRVKVNMEFDYSTIPHWMIQYHPYYIYRSMEFDY
ncbi:MAG: DUF5395 domain-containing protein [Desulfohalobiaceae bacterium]|nr:DUF5395 domain-containing protein [Desulfohalobiaceae bacterium]